MGKALAFVLVGIAVSLALWLGFKPQQGDFRTLSPAVAAVPANASPAGRIQPGSPARQKLFEIDIRDGKIVSGSPSLQVREGDEVTLKIISDRGDELHLHGYDLHAQLVAGEATTLAFTAARTGRFGLEMHHAHTELGTLDVYPR
jgi:hypothetical protein